MYGERIRQLRKEKGMTLRQLSDKLGIPFTTLGNYEREDRQPNFETFEMVADFFDVSIDYLAGRNEQRTYDEYVFHSNFKSIEELLGKASPEIREVITDIVDQLYLITRRDLKLGIANISELEHLREVLRFIFSMKNKFRWDSTGATFSYSDSNELAIAYLKEKHKLDKHLNELFEIYVKRDL
ncbi:helix-turn-helix domain-containing protein [Peribacillus sp. NPDC101481]|uniref:helix-turn-helix domain-containing protein n=1 Tax=Peribacillus sp. NPDC101481 TaxID=3364403 RepID=UPI0037F5DBDF